MPTQTELAHACGYRSTNAVRSHLRLLKKKRLLSSEPHKARSLRLASGDRPSRPTVGRFPSIPLVGTIAAGPLTEAIEASDEMLSVSPSLFRGADLFALRVNGESMKDAGVCSGDIAVINRQHTVATNQIAAVMVDGEATLKRVIKSQSKVVLRAANPQFKDIVIDHDDGTTLRILGRLVGIIRREIT